MTTINQGMSVEEIERVVAQRVANAIEAIAIYETKTNLARKSMSQTERQKEKVAENAINKRKWEGNHNGSSNQQNKGHKVPRAYTVWPINKKTYAGSLPLCHQTPATAKNQRTRTYYECGSLRHYKGECPIVKFHKRMDMIHRRLRASKPKTMQDAIEIATKLMNKKISTLVECQTENKKRLDNTSKNNQNQQQPNKRQNTGRAYTARHEEKKHYGGSKPLCSIITIMVHVLPNATTSNEELNEPMEDQPLTADASPTALSPGYVVDFDPKKDEKDPKEDPVDYPANGGNNDDDESSNDNDDDDDVEKDEEDKEEEEHLAPANPSDVSTDDLVSSS
nr:hypothetical protein [Tanacetum cinerariifolium]